MASANVKVFTDLDFDTEVIKSPKTVLVDFTAAWCGPCRALAPIIDEVADELGSEAVVAKVDIDESPLTAGKYGVRGVPTLMVFKNGERQSQHVGLTTKAKLLDLVRA
ncbi:MAG: thioredoxin [Polyangiaceae bacterium]|nr:thioredoxin [Polyangiaceae bacterium]